MHEHIHNNIWLVKRTNNVKILGILNDTVGTYDLKHWRLAYITTVARQTKTFSNFSYYFYANFIYFIYNKSILKYITIPNLEKKTWHLIILFPNSRTG